MTSVEFSQKTAPLTLAGAVGVVVLFLASGAVLGAGGGGGTGSCHAPAGAQDAVAAARMDMALAQTDRDGAAAGGSLYAAAKIGVSPATVARAEAADARFLAAQGAFRRLCDG